MSPETKLALAAARKAKREANLRQMPKCQKLVEVSLRRRKGAPEASSQTHEAGKPSTRVCGTPCIQNDVERERGTFWCPRCSSYAFGKGGGRAGGGPDKVPEGAWL